MLADTLKTVPLILLCMSACGAFSILELVVGPKLGSPHEESARSLKETDAERMIREAGYPVETHEVATEDNYLITLHRIPHGKKKLTKGERPPILLLHGLLASTEIWIINGPLYSGGYILADGGFDVWIMNFRGGYYSRGHKTLDPDNDAAYWNFNIEELGRYDVAAALEYLLNKTGHESSYLMGHSMGGTAGLILLSTRPEYNKKVKLFVNLATMAFVNHKLNPLFELGFNVLLPAAAEIVISEEIYEILPRRKLSGQLGKAFCEVEQELCLMSVYLATGPDPTFNKSSAAIMEFYPSGTSRNVVLHHLQVFKRRKLENLHALDPYNTLDLFGNIPKKEYDMHKITAPTALYYGDTDVLTVKEDVHYLATKLSNVVGIFRVPQKNFSHLSFVISLKARNALYKPLMVLMDKFR